VITEWSTGLGVSPAVNSVAAGPDGNIWFAESGGESAIGKITPG
jgi:streptogramin lyase